MADREQIADFLLAESMFRDPDYVRAVASGAQEAPDYICKRAKQDLEDCQRAADKLIDIHKQRPELFA